MPETEQTLIRKEWCNTLNKENMWIAGHWRDYELLDCSRGEKLERWGDVYLVRPDPQAIWDTPRRNEHWHTRNARYIRSFRNRQPTGTGPCGRSVPRGGPSAC